jgi:hypothetical protein
MALIHILSSAASVKLIPFYCHASEDDTKNKSIRLI